MCVPPEALWTFFLLIFVAGLFAGAIVTAVIKDRSGK